MPIPIPWSLIIQFILWLISIGTSKSAAVNLASKKFGVSAAEIFKRGGF